MTSKELEKSRGKYSSFSQVDTVMAVRFDKTESFSVTIDNAQTKCF